LTTLIKLAMKIRLIKENVRMKNANLTNVKKKIVMTKLASKKNAIKFIKMESQ
jgi:predicted Holliday junction resolvase-like endonuclease